MSLEQIPRSRWPLALWCALALSAACTRTACDHVVNENLILDMAVPDLSMPVDGGASDLRPPPDLLSVCMTAAECTTAANPACVDHLCAPCNFAAASDGGAGGVDGGNFNDPCSTHAATPYCGPAGSCEQCRSSVDCAADGQACHGGACGACTGNSDCTSGLCNAGACADASTLLYVDNSNPHCNDSSGAFATPFCTLQTGLNAAIAQSKTIIVLAGVGYNEPLSLTAAGTADVLNAVGLNAVVSYSMLPPLTVNGAVGKGLTASFDGFTFNGVAINPVTQNNAVTCNGDGSDYKKLNLTITRSIVQQATGVGIYATDKCQLKLDAIQIVGNAGGGLKLEGADFYLTNLLVVGNGTADASSANKNGSSLGGIDVDSAGEASNMTILNATVIANSASTLASTSGLTCLTPVTVANIVVVDNGGPALQISEAGCAPTYSAYSNVTISGAHNRDLTSCANSQLFVNYPTNEEVSKTGRAPCSLIGGGIFNVTGSITAPDHDLVGAPRPTSSIDIGCYQSQ